LFDRQSRIGDYTAQCPGSNMFVVGHDDTGMWLVATKNHVTTRLTPKYETGTLKCNTNFVP
jgi:hypothetical protein